MKPFPPPRRSSRSSALPALLALMCLLLHLPACDGRKESSAVAPTAVTIFVAASTREAVEEIASLFRRETGIEVKVSPGPSNILAAQIAEGAPADLFLSANEEWAESLNARGLVHETRRLLGNRLVIVVPVGNPAGVKSPLDLRSGAVKKVAMAGEKVPAGKYAEQALRSLALYEPLLADKRIIRGQDVRVALAYVERGEAEAGIAYATDARASKAVETACSLDARLHDPIVYPLLLLKAAEKSASSRKLYTFLGSPRARAVFERHGFIPLD